MYYLETSAKESDNVEKLFLDLACRLISEARQNTLVNNVSSPLPGEGKSISYLTCCNFNWRLRQGEAKGISSCPDGPRTAGQIWWWLWLPLLDLLTPVGSRAYTAWQARGFVHRPALAEHKRFHPFAVRSWSKEKIALGAPWSAEHVAFVLLKKQVKAHSWTQSRGKCTVGTPPARQWVHVGAIL